MKRFPACLFLLAACSTDAGSIEHSGPVERYAFVTTLGRDTVAIENVSRSARAMISDGVDKSPFVRPRHTVLASGDDGLLTHMGTDLRTPSGRTPEERWRRVSATFTADSALVTIVDSNGTTG